ncbi:MAG: response regulator [candidate division WOR-3 bacterium]|nr:response regulator [candidate division WOR-3 bacterium]
MSKILVVEDDANLSKLIRIRLEENGFEVITAYDGLEGISQVRKHKPDLIVLDLMLPKLDGYQVCTIIKNHEAFSKIPIVILTARSSIEAKEIALKTGAEAFIVKPFDGQKLVATIKNLLMPKSS